MKLNMNLVTNIISIVIVIAEAVNVYLTNLNGREVNYLELCFAVAGAIGLYFTKKENKDVIGKIN